jgi:precorrin-3B synthase
LLFGRVTAAALASLADEAQDLGAAELRLTPWRALLAVGLAPGKARELARRLERLSFLLDAADPRLAFFACPGAPACTSAQGDVRAVALALAPLRRAGAGRVHVSGCAKGCALNQSALTVVARENGFALIENGFARDEPDAVLPDLAALEETFIGLHAGATV